MSKGKELANVAGGDVLAALQESYPVEQGGNRIILPRLGMVSQDQVEGKGKTMKVVTEAGTFYTDKPTGEEDPDTGKKIYKKTELGSEIEGIILFQRKQLKMYDSKTESYTSSPVYDRDDEIVPIFCNKEEVKRGTPKELQANYEYTDENSGKVRSKLEVNRILYVEFASKGSEPEIYQMNLRGSSMFSFLGYTRKVLVPSVVTTFSSESKEKGKIAWNQMSFTPKRKLSQAEAEETLQKIVGIKNSVDLERAQYSKNTVEGEVVSEAEKVFNSI